MEELIISWQAALVAACSSGATWVVKRIVGLIVTPERRSGSRVWSAILGGTPVVAGALIAALSPIRPEFLIDFLSAHGGGAVSVLLGYALWGAVAGQMSGWIFDRFRDVRQ